MNPNFIGIGAQKCATTWLHLVLEKHPQVWMPPMKELHFFNRPSNRSHFETLLFDENNINSKNRFRYSDKKWTRWNYRYFFKQRDDAYYQSLFLPQQEQICGEITPSYATLEASNIEKIAQNYPNIKLIYLMRYPVERDWSQLCMTLENHFQKDISKLSVAEIMDFHKPKYLRQSDYATNSLRWEQYFPKEQIFYGFYEEIKTYPKAFLERLFQFLEIDFVSVQDLATKVNSFSKPIAQQVAKELARKELENIQTAHTKFDNKYTAHWLQQAERLINSAT